MENFTIKPGDIISLQEDGVSHPKMNIILAISSNNCLVLSIFINSQPDISFSHLQYELNPSILNSLHHPCYANCSKVFEKPYDLYRETLCKSSRRHKGNMPASHFLRICDLVKKQPTIKPSIKRDFPQFFSQNEHQQ